MFPKNILSVWLWDTFHFSLRCKKRYKKEIPRKLVSHFSELSIYIRVIQDSDKSAYRQEVKELAVWCNLNNMELNMLKTVEMIMDFRRNPPLTIMNSSVTAVESFRFLGTTISQDLKWDNQIRSMVKKAQQRLYWGSSICHRSCWYSSTLPSLNPTSACQWLSGSAQLPNLTSEDYGG